MQEGEAIMVSESQNEANRTAKMADRSGIAGPLGTWRSSRQVERRACFCQLYSLVLRVPESSPPFRKWEIWRRLAASSLET